MLKELRISFWIWFLPSEMIVPSFSSDMIQNDERSMQLLDANFNIGSNKNQDVPCSMMSIATKKLQTNTGCFYVLWDEEGHTIHHNLPNGEDYAGCYEASKCYSIEFYSDNSECEYNITLDGKVAKQGVVYPSTTVSNAILFHVGNCDDLSCGDKAELFLSTYEETSSLNYAIDHLNNKKTEGQIDGMRSKRLCIDLSQCNLMHNIIQGNAWIYLYENGFKHEGRYLKEYEQFGDCPTCPLGVFISAIAGSEQSDCYGYTHYEYDQLIEEDCLTKEETKTLCFDESKCNTIEHKGTAQYFIFKDSNFVDKGLSPEYRNFGACTCSDMDGLASTIRGQDILVRLSTISGMADLTEIDSPRYQTACWLINYDMLNLDATAPNLFQRYIISLIYFANQGVDWTYNYGFLSAKHECEWYHITCNNGVITNINLSNNNLVGNIVREMYWLLHLEYLHLDHNHLSDSIPLGIGQLNSKVINFEHNNLKGEIPNDIFDIRELETIKLDSNSLEGSLPTSDNLFLHLDTFSVAGNKLSGSIPDWIGRSTSIKSLNIMNNLFSGVIPNNFVNLSELNTINLHGNKLTGTIPSNMFLLSNLTSVRMGHNMLSGSIPEFIPGSLITHLSLKGNLFNSTIPEPLFTLPRLEQLYLSDNSFSGNLSIYTTSKSLSILELHKNNITGEVSFQDCSQFSILTADCNIPKLLSCSCCTQCHGLFSELGEDSYCSSTELSIIFRSSTFEDKIDFSLETLEKDEKNIIMSDYEDDISVQDYVYKSCISSTSCYYLTSNSYFYMITFDVLVDGNIIFKDVPGYGNVRFGYSEDGRLLSNTCDDYQICGLNLATNTTQRRLLNLATEHTDRVLLEDESSHENTALCWWLNDVNDISSTNSQDSVLIQRYALAILYFSTNGEAWDSSRDWMSHKNECNWLGVSCELHEGVVSKIDLSSNNLYGTIPNNIKQLLGLAHLNLAFNNLHGDIPQGLVTMDLLEFLQLSNNNLRNTIPSQIYRLLSLKVLDLSSNFLTGTLPSTLTELGELENIESLNLSNNDLSGPAFIVLSDFISLKYLNISHNLFKGQIRLEKMSNLERLDLSKNYFSGSIPNTSPISNVNLKSMFLNSNLIASTIPSRIGNLISLEELHLYDNNLRGTLPTDIANLRNLSQFSIAYNGIRGLIPSQFAYLLKLDLFQLHGNELMGDADLFNYSINSYISDCGNTQKTPGLVSCQSCTICCNSDGNCSVQKKLALSKHLIDTKMPKTSFIILMLWGISAFLMMLAYPLMEISYKFPQSFTSYTIREHFQRESVYRFFLGSNKKGWFIALVTIVFQTWITRTFLKAGDRSSALNEWVYTVSCPSTSTVCEDQRSTSPLGWIAFALIIAVFLLPDFADGYYVYYRSIARQKWKGIFAGVVVFYISLLTVVTSVIFLMAISPTDALLLKDVVCVLYLGSIDEQMLSIVYKLYPSFVENLDEAICEEYKEEIRSIKRKLYHENKEKNSSSSNDQNGSSENIDDLDQVKTSFNGNHNMTTTVSNINLVSTNEIIGESKSDISTDDYSDKKNPDLIKEFCEELKNVRLAVEDIKIENAALKTKNNELEKQVNHLQDQINNKVKAQDLAYDYKSSFP